MKTNEVQLTWQKDLTITKLRPTILPDACLTNTKQGIERQTSRIDPLGRPTVPAGSDHCFRTCCPSVPTFQNLAKQNKFQAKTMFTTGKTVGRAEWINERQTSRISSPSAAALNQGEQCRQVGCTTTTR